MSTFRKICAVFVLVVGVILIAAIASKISHKNGYKQGYSDALSSIKPDTEYVDKPIYIDKPVPEYHYKDTGRIVYIPVFVPDTTGHSDTTLVPMHPEVKHYKDPQDNAYELEISGIQPNLDWIKVNQKTAYITVPVPEYKYPTFTLSPTLGGFIFPNDYGAGAGMELDYWMNRWEVSGGGGYYVSSNSRGLYGEIKLKYNLIRK